MGGGMEVSPIADGLGVPSPPPPPQNRIRAPRRQTGLGFGSTMARMGGIMAPLVKMMEEYYPFLPPAVYGAAPIVAALVTGFLHETLNTVLPDTIEEVENRWVIGGGTGGWEDGEGGGRVGRGVGGWRVG